MFPRPPSSLILIFDSQPHAGCEPPTSKRSRYRAPEVLLQASVYGPAVDMWAMGAIMAELFNLRPLFPGTNEADEIHKICSMIGSPSQNSWADGLRLADAIKYQFPQKRRTTGDYCGGCCT